MKLDIQLVHFHKVNVLKKSELLILLFSNKMMVITARIHKMLVRIANREDPDQTASLEVVSGL